MCLLIFAYDIHPDFRLIAAANRDEFHERPTDSLGFWEDAPDILAGRDKKSLGTWMGVTRKGRFAALTNFRDPASMKPDAVSRGGIIPSFLKSNIPFPEWVGNLEPRLSDYNGFNLVAGDGISLFYLSSKKTGWKELSSGVYGLSNRFLDTPWPKVERARKKLTPLFQEKTIDIEQILDILGDRTRAPDEFLPDTGVGLTWERMLSPIFIAGPNYGTRSSSVLLMDREGGVIFVERTFGPCSDGIPERNTRAYAIGKRLNE